MEWAARGTFYKQACQEVDARGLSKTEAMKMKTERCKKLAAEFLSLLQQDNMMAVFAEAGNRMKEAMKQWRIIDTMATQLEEADSAAAAEMLLEKLKAAEEKWDQLHGYETFEDKGGLQYRYIKAQDYDDRITENISRFYACPHCGTYFFRKFWRKRLHRWYCEMDFAKWCQLADAEDVDRLKTAWGEDTSKWPVVGCGKLYKPWADGAGMVVEYKGGEGWKAFRADLIPEILDDCIKKKQVEFNRAGQCLTPEDVYDLIPRTYPKANPVPLADFEAFPGLGQFDFLQWVKDNEPMLTTEGWCKLAMTIASQDLANLADIFKSAEMELQKRGLMYHMSGKRDEIGPLTSVMHDNN